MLFLELSFLYRLPLAVLMWIWLSNISSPLKSSLNRFGFFMNFGCFGGLNGVSIYFWSEFLCCYYLLTVCLNEELMAFCYNDSRYFWGSAAPFSGPKLFFFCGFKLWTREIRAPASDGGCWPLPDWKVIFSRFRTTTGKLSIAIASLSLLMIGYSDTF